MKKLTMTLMIGAATIALSPAAVAQMADTTPQTSNVQSEQSIEPSTGGPVTTTGERMSRIEDGNMVELTGIVSEINGDEFKLNYGGNQMITVELDRFGFDGDETEYLTVGESVTVSGYIDDDLFEGREIEALDVRLNDSYVYYYYDTPNLSQSYSSYNNQERSGQQDTASANTMRDGSYFSMTGSVTEIDGETATIQGNNQTIEVDLSELGYDATDDEGLQKIETGDRLFVYGEIDEGFFNNRTLIADGAVEMQQRGNTSAASTATSTNADM